MSRIVRDDLHVELQNKQFGYLFGVIAFLVLSIFFLVRDGVWHPGTVVFSLAFIILGIGLLKVLEIKISDDEDLIEIEVGFWPFVRHHSLLSGDMTVLVEKKRVPRNSFFIYEMRIRDAKNRKLVFHVFRDRDIALHVIDELRARGCHTTLVD